jgi:uncharacterized damage-inducible protein DinB
VKNNFQNIGLDGFLCQLGEPSGREAAMTPEEARELLAFNAWANQRILGAVEPLTTEQFTQPLVSSFTSVRDTLVHIYGAERIWLKRLQGSAITGFAEGKDFPEFAGLRTKWAELEERVHNYASKISQAELDEVVEYKTFSFGHARTPRWQMIQHVVNHGNYHRGQVVTLLRQLSANGVGTDLILFYRDRASTARA